MIRRLVEQPEDGNHVCASSEGLQEVVKSYAYYCTDNTHTSSFMIVLP